MFSKMKFILPGLLFISVLTVNIQIGAQSFDNSEELISEEISGTFSESPDLDYLFNEASQQSRSGMNDGPVLENLTYEITDNDTVVLKGELYFDDNSYEISSEGIVHMLDTGRGVKNHFMLEMDDTDDYHFVQVYIREGNEVRDNPVTILLQDKHDDSLLYFETSFNNQVLDDLASIADTDQEAFRELLDMEQNLSDPPEKSHIEVRGRNVDGEVEVEAYINGEGENISRESKVDPPVYYESEDYDITPYSAPFSNWRDFFEELELLWRRLCI